MKFFAKRFKPNFLVFKLLLASIKERDRTLGQMDLHDNPVHPFFCIIAHLIQPLPALCQGLPSKAAAMV